MDVVCEAGVRAKGVRRGEEEKEEESSSLCSSAPVSRKKDFQADRASSVLCFDIGGVASLRGNPARLLLERRGSFDP